MKLLLDTHIALDVLLKRMPWLPEADALWKANDLGRFTACLTPIPVFTPTAVLQTLSLIDN